MLFAAGRGTRLAPLTDRHPKCLMMIGNKPLLEHHILKLRDAGVTTVVINTHHFAEQVEAFVESNDFGVTIHLSHEAELLGQGGGLWLASKYFQEDSPFLVCNSDIYTALDLSRLVSKHEALANLATLAVAQRETSRYLRFDDHNQLCGWENRSTGAVVSWDDRRFETWAFNGVQVMSPGIFKHMEGMGSSFSTIPVFLKAAQDGERVGAFAMDESYWIDIGTVQKLEQLRAYIQ